MEDDDSQKEESSALRSVGERLGGWAKRVTEFVAETTGRPVTPEGLKQPLKLAASLRLSGEHTQALTVLRGLEQSLQQDPSWKYSLGLTHVFDLLVGGRPIKVLNELADDLSESALGRGPGNFLRGAVLAHGDNPQDALDEFRRSSRDLDRLEEDVRRETQVLIHLLSGLVQLQLGQEDRSLRDLRKTRALAPRTGANAITEQVLGRGVMLALAAGESADAESWCRQALADNEDDPAAKGLLARALAARGDRIGAHTLVAQLEGKEGFEATALWVGLVVGVDPESSHRLTALALRQLQLQPEDLDHKRHWALARLSESDGSPPSDDFKQEVVAPLMARALQAPAATRDRFLQEVSHVALRLDWFPESVCTVIEQRLSRDEATAPEELRLVRARSRLAAGREAGEDFVQGSPVVFRADADIRSAWGPDPTSPVRKPDTRHAVLMSQRSLASAEANIAGNNVGTATDLLVEALARWPDLPRARTLLREIMVPYKGSRLEDLLTTATTVLAAVPNQILGVSLAGVGEALARVIAARERLARPLTIAIMGEFSAGKSTFVNALLAEAVAPMGVLPTTTTINVFRRGAGGGARVHYRDGRISLVDASEVQKFLHGLDDTEAGRIRHVEIERTGQRMGDAAVVDTPGLNALDAFHEQVAREFLDEADAVIWVFSATRSGAASEVGMLDELRASGRQVLGVLNKVDTLDSDEQAELSSYLREQLGSVLVDIVPLRAKDALSYRTSEQPKGPDPFAQVENALETHFLQKARELKRSLTSRRLDEALGDAYRQTSAGIEMLEQRAAHSEGDGGTQRDSAQKTLLDFGNELHAGVLAVDDLLTREALGLGLLHRGKGLSRGPVDPLDAEYLGSTFRDGAIAALQRTLSQVAIKDAVASEVLDRVFVAWARGHLEGLLGSDFITRVLEEHGPKITEGEAAARAGFRVALRPVADAWLEQARRLVHDLERARNEARRHGSSAPRAEALRLRATVLTMLSTLRDAAQEAAKV